MSKGIDQRFKLWGLDPLLRKYRGLGIQPRGGKDLVMAGELTFTADHRSGGEITDTYEIEIQVPDRFPQEVPDVWERGGRIPPDFHKMTDGNLCLGSPIRLQMRLRKQPDLIGFVESCVIPYLYGHSCFERTKGMPFRELDHGNPGLIADYMALLQVDDPQLCIRLLRLASLERRKANRERCPCRSGLRLGNCHHRRVNALRQRAGRRILRFEFHRLEHTLRKTVTRFSGETMLSRMKRRVPHPR